MVTQLLGTGKYIGVRGYLKGRLVPHRIVVVEALRFLAENDGPRRLDLLEKVNARRVDVVVSWLVQRRNLDCNVLQRSFYLSSFGREAKK